MKKKMYGIIITLLIISVFFLSYKKRSTLKDNEVPVGQALRFIYSMNVEQVHFHVPNALHAPIAVGAGHPR